MKVALIGQVFSPTHGGLERFSYNLASTLSAEGHEVHVYALRTESLPEAVQVHRVPVARRPRFLGLLDFHWKVRRALAEVDFDITYGLVRCFPLHVYRMGDGIQRHWLRLRYPSRLWRWLNCLVNPVHLVNLYLEKRIFAPRNCRRIVTNSQLCREHAMRYYQASPDRVKVIYNGVDHDLFNPQAARSHRDEVRAQLGLTTADVAIVYASNNWSRKGLPLILRAMAILGERGKRLHIVVVGRGRSAPMRSLAERLGLTERLHIVGPTRQIQRYYGAGDLLVLPTLYDPFANVCLEAMACGLAVVTTAENGASELICDGVNGYVQKNARDAEELAELLCRCLEKNRLQVMGEEARRTSLSFTRERNMLENLELFDRLLGDCTDDESRAL